MSFMKNKTFMSSANSHSNTSSYLASLPEDDNHSRDKKDNTNSLQHALARVLVPPALLEGVSVLRVKVNGSMRESFLTLSEDRFTLHITSSRVSFQEHNNNSVGSNSSLGKAFLRSWKSGGSSNNSNGSLGNDKHATSGGASVASSTAISSAGETFATVTSSSTNNTSAGMEERSIDIGAIDRIQRGQVTHKFELAKHARLGSRRSVGSREDCGLKPDLSFSIIFRGARTLDLMIHDYHPSDGSTTGSISTVDRDYILDALDDVIQAYQHHKVRVYKDMLLLRYIWLDVDKSKTNTLNCNAIAKVLERINCHVKKQELHQMYDRFAKIIGLTRSQRSKGFTYSQCCTFLHKIKRDSWMVKPVNVIWNDLFGEIMNNGKLRATVSDKTFLEKFLHAKQGETSMELQDVRRLFQRLHQMEMPLPVQSEGPIDPTRINKDHFEAYLSSADNDAFDPARERYDPRLMVKPISEYWINSSHNTYLTGDQFTSHSSVEMYMNALYRGCRCLELDIWDGEVDTINERPVPVVWHGHTMTSKILFVDILQCFQVFLNFHPDTYPLVLSFENHCSLPYQEVMAEDLMEVLGDKLYIPTEDSLFGRLPSPEDMRGLVVIKGRRPEGSIDDLESDEDSEDDELISNSGTDMSRSTSASYNTKPAKKVKVCPALARLTLFHGCKLKNWDASVRNPTHHMHSFSENKVKKMCRQGKSHKWAIYNQSHMSRTYPAGSRVDSSNYNPMLAWSTGCQLVALNFQTPDPPLKINDGRFRENGNCGYVLKPSNLMMRDEFSQGSMPVKLSVRVLSGSCLPKPKGARSGDCINPYVKVFVYDIKNEEKEACTTYQTPVVQNNGYTPIWYNANSRDRFSFIIETGAVAMLHLEVYTKGDIGQSDEFIAFSAIPITCLRQGYRNVQLFDNNNTRTGPFDFASLLIEVKIKKVAGEI